MFFWDNYGRPERSELSCNFWVGAKFFCARVASKRPCVAVDQDLANQVKFSEDYRKSLKNVGMQPGRYLHPEVAEYFSGPSLQ